MSKDFFKNLGRDKDKPKESEKPTKLTARPTAPTAPRPQKRPPRTRQPKIDPKTLVNDIIAGLSQTLTETIETKVNEAISQQHQPVPQQHENMTIRVVEELSNKLVMQEAELAKLRPLEDKAWDEVNRLRWMNEMTRPGKKGFKRVEMERFFGSRTVTWNDIDSILAEYHKMRLLRKDRAGWYSLTPKGRKHYQDLLDVKNSKKK